MTRYAVIAVLYLFGSFVSGGYYHRDATEGCFQGVYPKTIVVMAFWPLASPKIILSGMDDGCKK